MNVQLGKVMPIGLLVGMVGYCCWPYLAGPERGAAAEARKLPLLTAAMLRPLPGAAAQGDPFRMTAAAAAAVPTGTRAAAPAPAGKGADPAADTAALLGRLALRATYVHGPRRVALINGL